MSGALDLHTQKPAVGRESVIRAERTLCIGKTEAVFRFTGVCVGNGVVAGKMVAGLGVAYGLKVVRLCKSTFSAACRLPAGTLPRAQRASQKTTVRCSPALLPIYVARTAGFLLSRVPVRTTLAPTGKAIDVAAPGTVHKADVIEQEPPCPREPRSTVRFSDLTPMEVEAAEFGSAAQKLLFKKGLSDLEDGDIAVRTRAAKALGRIPHALSGRVLAAHFFRESSPQVRRECVNALTALDVKTQPSVVEHALLDDDVSVRLAAVMAAFRLVGLMGAWTVIGMFNDPDIEVRRMAACCLGWMGQEELGVELVPLLGDEAVEVRRAAAEAIGGLRDNRAVPSLIECLNDVDDSVRGKALEALEKITGKKMHKKSPETEKERERTMVRWRDWWKKRANKESAGKG